MLLADPFATESFIEKRNTGLKNFSISREATIPITPGCQLSS